MTTLLFGYYALMLACFILSLFYRRHPLVKWLGALLLVSILTEAVVEIMGKKDLRFFSVYHFFIPFEYLLVTVILSKNVRRKKIRQLMIGSIAFFWLLCVYISFRVQPPPNFPSLHGNIEGVLVIAWCLASLLSIEPVESLSIFQLPAFWIALAFLIYFLGSMTVNSVYNTLLSNQSATAKHLFSIFNSISNYLLYIFLGIGIICHKWEVKFSTRS